MPGFDHFELTEVLIGGKRVGYTVSTRCLQIAGDEIPVEQWLETRRRIDLIIRRSTSAEDWRMLREKMAWLGKRDRLPQELRDYEAPPHPPASGFLTRNLIAINQLKGGTLRPAPLWLRWLYRAVVTKEQYGNNHL